MEQKLTYSEAFNELKTLIDTLESSDVNIDVLETKIKRAALLIDVCKTKLSEIENNTEEIISRIEQTEIQKQES